jgi:hypothetical protein
MSHHYGRDGRESKKIDTKSIILDFELFKKFSHADFISTLNNSIFQFVDSINKNSDNSKYKM